MDVIGVKASSQANEGERVAEWLAESWIGRLEESRVGSGLCMMVWSDMLLWCMNQAMTPSKELHPAGCTRPREGLPPYMLVVPEPIRSQFATRQRSPSEKSHCGMTGTKYQVCKSSDLGTYN